MDEMNSVDWWAMTLTLMGGLAFFMYGMQKMTDGLKLIAGDGMRTVLGKLTTNRYTGVLTGALVTAVIQSSSITAVLVVGFVSAGVLNLTQSVGIIMGANIGTTVTAQIIAFKVTQYALLLIVIGFAGLFVMPQQKVKQIGAVILGLGLIFYGMDLMSEAARPLRTYPPFIGLMQDMTNPIWGMLLGLAFTAIVQSSSATTGIVIVLAGQGLITLEVGIALIFGANIGTCITAYLSALGKPREAMQTAGVHVLFNVLGVLLWIFFIPYLAELVRWMSPTSDDLQGIARLSVEAPRQIANAHTVFNVSVTLVFVGLAGTFSRIVKWVLPDLPAAPATGMQPIYLADVYLQTPGMALDRVRLELDHLGSLTIDLLKDAPQVAMQGTRGDFKDLRERKKNISTLHSTVVNFLERITQPELTKTQTGQMRELVAIANYLDNIADTVDNNIVTLGEERLTENLSIDAGGLKAIQPCIDEVVASLELGMRALAESDISLAGEVIGRKDHMKDLASDAITRVNENLAADMPNRLKVLALETEMIELLKRLFYFSRRIARETVKLMKEDHKEAAAAIEESDLS